MIIGACGRLGSGKTLIVTMFGYDYYVNSDLSILANFDASFTDKRIDPIELMLANRNIRDSVILLTEAHQLFDSRFSVSLVVIAFGLCYFFVGKGYYYMFRLEGREKKT